MVLRNEKFRREIIKAAKNLTEKQKHKVKKWKFLFSLRAAVYFASLTLFDLAFLFYYVVLFVSGF